MHPFIYHYGYMTTFYSFSTYNKNLTYIFVLYLGCTADELHERCLGHVLTKLVFILMCSDDLDLSTKKPIIQVFFLCRPLVC